MKPDMIGETKDQTETVGFIRLDGESGGLAFVLPDDTAAMMEEATGIVEGSYLPEQTDDDDERPLVTIEIRRKPTGYVASLPEFEGW